MLRKPKKARSEMATALFQRAGNAAKAIAVDTRVKCIDSRKRYTRKGRSARAWLRD